jgi:SAM-dependent methyltransferase
VTEWFERWFGEAYLALYPHRDEEEAERVVALLERLGVIGRGRVLDLACGAGRYLDVLARRGAMVAGLDLSLPLLRTARGRGARLLVRGDVRALPIASGAFDAVLNLFTSFGYFEDDAQHQRVLAEVARVLKPGGRFVLDFLNAPQLRATLVPHDERRVGESVVVQERRISDDGRFVVKTIHLSGEGHSFMERVRLLERADLERMCAAAGLTVERVLGDYEGGAYDRRSPRCLIVARS